MSLDVRSHSVTLMSSSMVKMKGGSASMKQPCKSLLSSFIHNIFFGGNCLFLREGVHGHCYVAVVSFFYYFTW